MYIFYKQSQQASLIIMRVLFNQKIKIKHEDIYFLRKSLQTWLL